MERDALAETAVSIGGVLIFVAAAFVIGVEYTEGSATSGQLLNETGAYGLVAAIAGFVVLMSVIGVWLSRR
jgi:hypothetical protein